MKTIKFKTNINCNGCIKAVTPFLNSEASVEKWNVDIENADKILTVEGENVNDENITGAVEKAGFKIKKMK